MTPDDPASKLYIDEDWKQQAQAEKEALAREAARSGPASLDAPEASAGPAVERPAPATEPPPATTAEQRPPLPPASLPLLVTMFATEAMVALGQIPSPLSGQAELDRDAARHYIDMLDTIEEKTEGNRTPDETAMLRHVLHDLRMAFVALRERK